MSTTFMLGTAKVDITPTFPLPLAGFASRSQKGTFEEVTHPLYAKIFVFSQQKTQGKNELALLISADLLWWGSDQVVPLKRQIFDKWGIESTSVILHATHTHSGPQTSYLFTDLLGKPDADYIDLLASKVLQGIAYAISALEPVIAERGEGICGIGIHRRKEEEGKIVLAPNDEGPVDPEVHVVRFRNLNGVTRGVLVHFTCHPTISSDNRISSEFCGVAMEQVEKALGHHVISAYLQGFCGDIAPIVVREGKFINGQDAEVCRLGNMLANEVLQVLSRPMTALLPAPIQAKTVTVELPLRKLPTASQLRAGMQEDGVIGQWSRLFLAHPERLVPTVLLEMTILHIADDLSFAAMNAEMVVEYGLLVKQLSDRMVLPIAYSNGMIGYVPTARQIRDGGYESDESTLYFALPAPLNPVAEQLVHQGIHELLKDDFTTR